MDQTPNTPPDQQPTESQAYPPQPHQQAPSFLSQGSGPLLPPARPQRIVPPAVRGEPMNLKRWWETASTRARGIAAGVAAVIVVCGCCSVASIVAAGGGKSTTPDQSQNSGQQAQQATSAPTATFTPAPPTATPVPPTPTRAPSWQTVQTYKGNGISKTPTFTVDADQWRIHWSCNPQAYGFEYNLIADLTVPGDSYGDPVVNAICKTDDPSTTSGETMEYTPGTFYLDVNSEATWEFDIQVYQ